LSIFSSTSKKSNKDVIRRPSPKSPHSGKYEEPFSYDNTDIYPKEQEISHEILHQPRRPIVPRGSFKNINTPLTISDSKKYNIIMSRGNSSKMVGTGKSKKERKINQKTRKNMKSCKKKL
jgi:hypothetical protein